MNDFPEPEGAIKQYFNNFLLFIEISLEGPVDVHLGHLSENQMLAHNDFAVQSIRSQKIVQNDFQQVIDSQICTLGEHLQI